MNKKSGRRMNKKFAIAGLTIIYALIMLFEGCMVGPNFVKPQTKMPSKYLLEQGPKGESPDPQLVNWWKDFNDPNLTSLIERAFKSNLDMKLAEQRIRQARGQLGIAQGAFWPTVDATSSTTRNRTSSFKGQNVAVNSLFRAGLDASWEIDVFGGTRRNIESAKANVLANIENSRDVRISLASEVALNYVQLRSFQQQIIIAQNNLETQQHTADIVRKRLEVGLVSKLDLANALAQVATTRSQIPVLESSAQQTIYNIGVLLGQEPESLVEELTPKAEIPSASPSIPTGLPSELLRRRPDIRSAEAQIHAQTAQIGVATADLFPKFNLTGSIGFSGSGITSLRWDNRSWSFGPSVSWNIFAGGAIVANIEVQKALQQQTILNYKKTVLTALQDVENALIAYLKELQHKQDLAEAVTYDQEALDFSKQLYEEGLIDFITVLDAQRSLYATQQAFVISNQNLSDDLIALYKALGGGWDTTIPDTN